MSTDPARRESPATLDARRYKAAVAEEARKATETKTADRGPGQETDRQPENCDSLYTTRRHKSIFGSLSPRRMDSREEIYAALDAWAGQGHE